MIRGYGCGASGEPCDATSQPYFLQGNQATRGQIAKIIALSITTGGLRAVVVCPPPQKVGAVHPDRAPPGVVGRLVG